jgi:PAS domain S-box-containing protein
VTERILIVEDDPATREGLTMLLETLGYSVATAPDGLAALAALKTEPPDVMLLDLILPGDISGIQILQTARQVVPQVGAIIMTGYPNAETTVEALRLGAFDYLTKPFDLGRMSSLLTQLVNRQRQARRAAETLGQLETISRCNRIGIYSVDLTGTFTYWGCSGLLGYLAEEVTGRTSLAALVVTPGFDMATELEACRRAGSTLREDQVRRRDGAVLTIRTKLVSLFDPEHRPIGYAAYLLDVSEEQRLRAAQQEQLLEMESRLREQAQLADAVRILGEATRNGVRLPDLISLGLAAVLGSVVGARFAWCFLRTGQEEGLRPVPVEDERQVFLGGAAHAGDNPHVSAAGLCGAGPCDCVRKLAGLQVLPLQPAMVPCRRLPALAGSGAGASAGHLSLPLVFRGDLIGTLNVANEGYGTFTSEETSRLAILGDTLAAGIAATRLAKQAETRTRHLRETQGRTDRTERLRAVGELASGVAHDFNNLLTAILGSAELLSRTEGDTHRQEELQTIRRAARDGAEMVRRILEYTRTRREPHLVAVDLPEVVREAVELTRGRWKNAVQARGVTIEIHLELQPVPQAAGNPSELREMLTNLILNAVDAMPQGGHLTLGTHLVPGQSVDPPEWIEVTVADTGAGMAPEILDRIFDPFFSTKEGSGVGLGLAVAHGIVERHQGEIAVRSVPGEGTTFTVRLPAASADTARPPAEASGGPVPVGEAVAYQPSARVARILVVDDEPKLAQLLRSFLELQGHRVWTVTEGAAAVTLLSDHVFDLLLTDLGMPEMSGWDVAREARRLRPHLPVIMVSGWGAQIDPQQVAESGVAEVVQKPYTFETIHQVIESVLRQHPPDASA